MNDCFIELSVYDRNKDNNFEVYVNDAEIFYNYGSSVFPPETTLKEIFEWGKKVVDKQNIE